MIYNLSASRWFAEYFSAKLVKTCDLDPEQNYIMCYHPHGVYGLSMFANVMFSTDFRQFFKGIRPIAATLPINFWVVTPSNQPFWRDFLLATGTISCDKLAVHHTLSKKKNGTTLVVMVGGAKEFLKMEYGCMDIVLKNRKGFVRLSLSTGTPLLPVIGFGENELYIRIDNPLTTGLQNIANRIGKFQLPFIVGRGASLIPRRHRLVTVVGKPIPVTKTLNPTQQQIDELHDVYILRLKTLYDDHKNLYRT